ncbi:MAG: diacylglycerol kinase family protein [Anaerolineales bacterium]|nr:diacylglycerol kinase family protein [Anaerolineales bacterium]
MRYEAYSRIRSFKYAFQGWWFVLQTQHNAWIHAVASVVVVPLALWLRVSRLELAVIFLAITAVWVGEFLNTAIEAVVDMASPEFHPLAKVAKDVAAAAVLLAAIAAVLIGLLILGPPLVWRLFGYQILWP